MRSTREEKIGFAVIQLVALAIAAGVCIPPLRGFLVIMAGLSAVAFIIFIFYRIRTLQIRSNKSPTNSNSRIGVREPPPLKGPTPQNEVRTAPPEADIKERLRSLDWFQFEQLVAALFHHQGYSAERSGGANPDGGIDIIITRDQRTKAVQCKHWKTWNIGVKEIREFLGALTDRQVQSGIFVTLSGYSGDAISFAAKHSIQLIDENEMIQMLNDLPWQLSEEVLAVLNDKRKLCPKCESEMVLRTARQGSNVGDQFWGCSKFPSCRYTLKMNAQPGS